MPVDVSLRELTREGDEDKFRWKLPVGIGILTGPDMLAQLVGKSLLTTPGTDLFNKQWGGGLHGALPAQITQSGEIDAQTRDMIFFSVSKVEDDIRSSQRRFPPDLSSTLESLQVLSVVPADDLSTVTIKIRITTADKQNRYTEVDL